MNVLTMLAICVAVTVIFTGLCVLRLWKGGGKPKDDVIKGALFQSTLFGIIIGFLVAPNAPPPPPGIGVGFLIAIPLMEIVRSGLLLRLRYVPKEFRRYRLASLALQRDTLDRQVKSLKALIEADDKA